MIVAVEDNLNDTPLLAAHRYPWPSPSFRRSLSVTSNDRRLVQGRTIPRARIFDLASRSCITVTSLVTAPYVGGVSHHTVHAIAGRLNPWDDRMRPTTWLLILATAQLPGVILAREDLMLGLHGGAVNVFMVLCVVAAAALGTHAIAGLAVSLLRNACTYGRWSFASLR